jgi:hypothetical protein
VSEIKVCALSQPNSKVIKKTCNLWHNYGDISDSWSDVKGIMNYFGSNQDRIIQHAGPGYWNDPDMVGYKFLT